MSRLRRPFLSDRFFFVAVRLLKRRIELQDADFHFLALAFRRARPSSILFDRLGISSRPRARHLRSTLSAHHLRGDEIDHVAQTSVVEVCGSSLLINRRRSASGEVWQGRFFDPAPLPLNIFGAGRRRALRTVKEYNEKVEYIHLNPVKAGLVIRPQNWRWSSVNEYSGVSAAEQDRRCGLTIDRVNMPSDPNTRI